MTERRGDTLLFHTPPVIAAQAAAGGKKESEGPLAAGFDELTTDNRLGQCSWEAAEKQLQLRAARLCLQKAGLPAEQVDLALAGDLQAQCTASGYALRELGVPFAGLFGACSTMAESLTLAALLVESGAAEKALAVTSSHFCSSERQFRFPLNYGGVRTPTAQHTATASGAALVGKQGSIHIEEVCIGRVVDLGVTDLNNMGAAMAPAAWDTLRQYFADTGTGPADYDKIITGDLAQVGSDLLVRLAAEEGCDLRPRYTDCGLMLYDREGQKVDAGASGCGCSAAVMCAHFLPAMQRGEYKNILFMATGALMSPTACQQGESIPGVAHLLHLTAAGEPLS